MSNVKQRLKAKDFVEKWKNRGDEKQDTQSFWIDLLSNVYDVENTTDYIDYEKRVKVGDNTKFIDGYIADTRVLIEQKSLGIDLNKPERQSGGAMLTPYEQAKRYANELPQSEHPKWIVVSDFKSFRIYNMDSITPEREVQEVLLENLSVEFTRMNFLVNSNDDHTAKELEVSIKAGELVGKLYDALLKQYKDPESEKTLQSLNKLCVRLVFCLYAEDADIFGGKNRFHDYLMSFRPENMRKGLIELFKMLNTPVDMRDPYENENLLMFPYVNGGLFAEDDIEIPHLTDEIRDIILNKASADFDWSLISPTIFGAVFESTLNPETRRSGGMHYTSIENIHKVIDPLFLDELKIDLESFKEDIKNTAQEKRQKEKLKQFQEKLASIEFLDPAAGSGNFLTETYLSLRRIENEAIETVSGGQMEIATEFINPIKVSIAQFHGIEINDFAVTVARTALWIAESQMMAETEEIIHANLDFLPLKTQANIVQGNALRMNWEDVFSRDRLDYIMGNPPFIGYSLQTSEQKKDLLSIYVDEKGKPYKAAGKIDYVSGWYFKAAEFMQNTGIRTALVSTNSITQGEQVAGVWKPLYDRFGVHIDFAHRTFRWDSEAIIKAQVHCVIVGFSTVYSMKQKQLYSTDKVQLVDNINAYLIEAPNVFIESRTKALCDVPQMIYGNKPTDGGHLLLTAKERDELAINDPAALKYVRQIYGATEYINNKIRYCLWLVGISPAELRNSAFIRDRVEKVREFRLNSTKDATRRSADAPTLFQEIRHPNTSYIIIPRHSSENRRYIPFGFVNPEIIVNDAVQIIPNAKLYHFGVMMSNVHMAWTRAVCGRIKSDYRYSKDIVYNNFPWPTPTGEQKSKIEQTAQEILDARELYPDSSLADLYDELAMPPELRRAHQANDRAVMQAYGFDIKTMTESSCVAELMKMYQKLTE